MKHNPERLVGVLPLARPTFDVPYAEERAAAMFKVLEETGARLSGSRSLLFDAAAARSAVEALKAERPDVVLVMQVTFTDAGMAVEIGEAFDCPIAFWSIPEPRAGGRLRLNSFCGMNLAGHALGLAGRAFGYLHAQPEDAATAVSLAELIGGGRLSEARPTRKAGRGNDGGKAAVDAVRGARIGRIGERPGGFQTCDYDPAKLAALADVTVEPIELGTLFGRAASITNAEMAKERESAEAIAGGMDAVDQEQLGRSLRLRTALGALKGEGGYDAFAIRCWPETFTEYGGAVCGPVAMMGEARTPCACEADVYGALTTLLLQKVAGAPAFLADLVDVDLTDDTGVVWHCGQAPASMADRDFRPRATIHSNRRMPLLFEFPLKPGRVTLFRISQARGKTAAVIGGGEVLSRPMAFTGTSGVIRFDSGAAHTLKSFMDGALEHHLALAYGDHRATLESAAAELGIPVFDL